VSAAKALDLNRYVPRHGGVSSSTEEFQDNLNKWLIHNTINSDQFSEAQTLMLAIHKVLMPEGLA
jgi:hypothetical protein